MIKFIGSDLDHTLLNNESKISPLTNEVINLIHTKGITFVPCTARNYKDVPTYFINNDKFPYLVCNNGGDIIDNLSGERILERTLSTDLSKNIIQTLLNYSKYWTLSTDEGAYTNKKIIDDRDELSLSDHYIETVLSQRILIYDYESLLNKDISVYKVQTYLKDPSIKNDIARELMEKFPEVQITTSGLHNIEILHIEATKGNAFSYLLSKHDVNRDQAITFGDNHNDVSLIKCVEKGYAVSNGVDALKEAAYKVIGCNDEDAVAKKILIHLKD